MSKIKSIINSCGSHREYKAKKNMSYCDKDRQYFNFDLFEQHIGL